MVEKISSKDLDLSPGYRAERDGVDISLIDPEGRRVARLPGGTVPEDGAEAKPGSRSEELLAPPDEDWRQGLCRALLLLAYSHAVECEVLRERVERLGEQLKKVEEERDTSERIAEDLYQFFSRTARKVASRKQAQEGRPHEDRA